MMTEEQHKKIDQLEDNGWTLMCIESSHALLCNYDTGEWVEVDQNGTEKNKRINK